jgi:hypothetical protein
MSATPRLAFPYVLQSQSQKEVTVNSALNRLDALLQAVVEDMDLAAPPASPAEGGLWIVASGGSGAWAGHDGELAHFIGGAWTFYTPPEGMRLWVKDDGVSARRTAGGWDRGVLAATSVTIDGEQVVGARQAAIPDAAGGGTQDSEARAAINALLAACRNHGLISI